MNINDAVKEHCKHLFVPGYYMGVIDKTVDKQTSFWRDFFAPRSRDIQHDKGYMFWDEIVKRFPTYFPTDICPCDEGDYFTISDSSETRFVSQGYWFLGFPIDCDWTQFCKPGENPYNSEKFIDRLGDHMLELRTELFRSFDIKEEFWTAMMATQGYIVVEPKGGKPYEVHFKRDEKLNCVIEEPECLWCQDPGKGGEYKHRPWEDIRRMREKFHQFMRGKTDNIIMNHTTCDWMRNAVNQMYKDCKDTSTVEILLPHMRQIAGYEIPPPMDGAELAFVIPGQTPINVWCVETNFEFCDPDTGQDVCVNPIKDGKVYGYNLAATDRNRFNATWSYGRISNYHADNIEVPRFYHQYISDSGKSMKNHGESAPMIMIECPNASWCLDVCGGKPPEKKVIA